jgi:hypothetical protein
MDMNMVRRLAYRIRIWTALRLRPDGGLRSICAFSHLIEAAQQPFKPSDGFFGVGTQRKMTAQVTSE